MRGESTASDLVAMVRAAIDAANRGDYDALAGFLAPDVVWRSLDGLGTFEGVSAVRGFLEEFGGAYESFDTQAEEILDLGCGVVFAVIRHTARLGSGVGRVDERFAWVLAVEDGAVVRALGAQDIEQARTAGERLAEEHGRGA
jgi:ketosteroid isomerase-like protein